MLITAALSIAAQPSPIVHVIPHSHLDTGWLKTVDHMEPTVEAMHTACSFIEHHRKNGTGVYIHCKSGRGRSAAVAMDSCQNTCTSESSSAEKRERQSERSPCRRHPLFPGKNGDLSFILCCAV